MSSDDDGVSLGEKRSVPGAPLARVASRLSWPLQKSKIVQREGDTAIRTPDGPKSIEEVLEEVSISYFATRNEFIEAIQDETGEGPVPTDAE